MLSRKKSYVKSGQLRPDFFYGVIRYGGNQWERDQCQTYVPPNFVSSFTF